MLTTVSVKVLAEFLYRRGDLYPPLGGRVTGEQGITAQQRVQRERTAGYRSEVVVEEVFVRGALSIALSGRVDGCDLATEPALVEEIKTTRADPAEAERLVGSAHWAQLTLYAALLALSHPELRRWQLRLTYCHPIQPQAMSFERAVEAVTLQAFLAESVDRYGRWLATDASYRGRRDQWLARRAFPYGEYRPHQRALAGRVYRALEGREHLLLEASTGSGKTMGVIFPALKALADGHVSRLFFLTSRGTGSLAALKACRDVGTDREQIRVVELTAKEKVCPVPGVPCDGTCPYQTGYYDRVHDAVSALLAMSCMDRNAVRTVAEDHTVCPFELSLDAALWADLVIGDYNYLLDPMVRLKRFADDRRLGVLIDESHQLADRVRDMLSLDLDRAEVRTALADPLPERLARGLRGLDRALLSLRRAHLPSEPAAQDEERIIDVPRTLLDAMARALDALAEEEVDLAVYPHARSLVFNLARWVRSASWMDAGADTVGTSGDVDDGRDHVKRPDAYIYLLRTGPGRRAAAVQVRLVCLDPGPYLARVLGGYGGHVRFSGTLSPLDLYQALHGAPDAPAERVASPFSPAQMATLVVTDLPVYYRARQHTLPSLADLVAAIAGSRAGSYLVALPSFEYLTQLGDALVLRHPSLETHRQQPGMSGPAREIFLDTFRNDGRTRVGLIVLGGVFGESVDFSHAPLAGVVCVGVGLPPVSRLRAELGRHFDAKLGPGGGETVAYQQPAMTKVLQMAGRLLRSPGDRGVLCLVDDRFGRTAYQRFFPGHWRPERIRARDVAARLARFWRAAPELPRLLAPSAVPAENNVDTLV